MKERSIIFSGPMVRAILEGRKTQTRRVIVPQPKWLVYGKREIAPHSLLVISEGRILCCDEIGVRNLITIACLSEQGKSIKILYRKRARLWVREAWRLSGSAQMPDRNEIPSFASRDTIVYRVDEEWNGPWRSPIHMPRWASRLTLEITKIRAERVQEISRDDCFAEGITIDQSLSQDTPAITATWPIECYRQLWDSIYTKRGFGWDVNPWVCVIEFKPLAVVRT